MATDAERLAAGQRVTWVGAGVNALLILVKGLAGVLGGSQALIADAVHSFSDFFTDAVVLVGLRMGKRAADEDHHFGHGRLETLASFLVSLSLAGVAVFLGWRAGASLLAREVGHPTVLAVAAAAFSILAKELLYHYTVRVGRAIKSPAVVANAWHHRSDALSSVAVLVGVGAAYLNPAWELADSWAALVVAAFVLHVGVGLCWDALQEFTDVAPDQGVLDRIEAIARETGGVEGVHGLRVRITGGLYQAEVHAEVDGDLSVVEGHRIADEVRDRLHEEIPDMARVIVHIDPWDDSEEEQARLRALCEQDALPGE